MIHNPYHYSMIVGYCLPCSARFPCYTFFRQKKTSDWEGNHFVNKTVFQLLFQEIEIRKSHGTLRREWNLQIV